MKGGASGTHGFDRADETPCNDIFIRKVQCMKRHVLCFALAAILVLPAFAAAEVQGVYIAPKFLLGIQESGQLSTKNLGDHDAKPFKQHSQAVFGGALAVGYNFGPKFNVPIRTEFEYALRSNSWRDRDGFIDGDRWSSKHSLNISTLFFNAYVDIPTGTPFTPYIGGGLGLGFNYTGMRVETGDGRVSWDQYNATFAWNAGGGVAYAFTENVSADIGYRFTGASYREIARTPPGGGDKCKLGSSPYINEFYLGARFTF